MRNLGVTCSGVPMEGENRDFYHKLRVRIRKWLSSRSGRTDKWADYLMFTPDLFHLLCKLSIDSEVPVKERGKLAAAIVYFVAPFDLVPEALMGVMGFADDIAIAAYVVNSLMSSCGPVVVQRHWAGDEDVLKLVQKTIGMADKAGRAGVLGKRGWKKIRSLFLEGVGRTWDEDRLHYTQMICNPLIQTSLIG